MPSVEPSKVAAIVQPAAGSSGTTSDGSLSFDRESEKTITVKQAAHVLGKSEDTVRLWLKSGRLKGWQPGGRRCAVLVTQDSLKKALSCSPGIG